MKAKQLQDKLRAENPRAFEKIDRDLKFQISTLIIHVRTMNGLTQAQLARKVKTKQPGIARAENGNGCSLELLQKILDSLKAKIIINVVL